MPVTLAQAQLLTTDDIDVNVIDEFRKESDVLNRITFDDVVSGAGNGGTLTYGYTRLTSQRGAGFRAINTEYTPTEVTKERATVDLKVMGGSFQIDRVLNNIAAGQETALQMSQLIKGSRATMHDQLINGDSEEDALAFDGLNKILRGSTTEYLAENNGVAAGYYDWTAIDTKAEALTAIEVLDDWLGTMDVTPDVIYGNKKTLAKFKMIAAWGDFLEAQRDEFDRRISTYAGIPLIELGAKGGSNDDVIPVETRDPDSSVWTLTISATGGTFTVTINFQGLGTQTTTAIAWNATAATVQTAVRALSNVDANITVTGSAGGPYTLTATDDQYMVVTASGASLTGGSGTATPAQSGTGTVTGLTDLYAVKFGLDSFHGVSAAGSPLVRTWLPDFTSAGAVKTGELEFAPVATVLKRTKGAAVLRNIKVR
jgi:hypothetical protein